MQTNCFRTIRKVAVAMVAVERSDSRICHHGNDLRAGSELDSGLLQNCCLCAQNLVPTLQVSLRLIHSGGSSTNCMTQGHLSDIFQNFSRDTHHSHFFYPVLTDFDLDFKTPIPKLVLTECTN